jgi:putative Mg2+ transporter-C (MgtC) family protein
VELWDTLWHVLLAAFLGGLIGLDRELEGHAAGLRTNILVAAAAAVFADVSINGFAELRGYDPSRVAADVVSGIGFIGAGAIFAMGGRPRGLTTAAALWTSAAIGLTVGVGRWQVGVALTVAALLALVALNWFADRVLGPHRTTVRDLYVVVPDATMAEPMQQHMQTHHVQIQQMHMVPLAEYVGIDLVLMGRTADLDAALGTIRHVEGIKFASDEKGVSDSV